MGRIFLIRSTWRYIIAIVLLAILGLGLAFLLTGNSYKRLMSEYNSLESIVIRDRKGQEILIKPNERGFYARYSESIPQNVSQAFLNSEDRFFYYHPGINPFSVARSFWSGNSGKGSSTITQQLVKVLLGNEQSRTLKNKIRELAYAFALELHSSKKSILTMYLNSAYFGGQAQGIREAGLRYYAKDPHDLTETELGELVRAVRSPGTYTPRSQYPEQLPHSAVSAFELNDLGVDCDTSCALSIDSNLSDSVRDILRRNLSSPDLKGAANGAVVVIKLPENELLAVIGSPDPSRNLDGYRINMARRPRQIGSTIKPFIYGRAFQKGLRPYTLVDDREYRYSIGTGFALYPKNFDYRYRGVVSLHYALSNSLNVPTVKTLEYVGPRDFYGFLTGTLEFKPLQELTDYELGIALGGLDMDLLTLSHYFTIFAKQGSLKPLTLKLNSPPFLTPMENTTAQHEVLPPPFVELVNKILTDRTTGVEQFGIRSSLNLPYGNYAVKTGTSREFHDSWTVGYTPDFLAAVWVGNADDTAMDQVSGSIGAGAIWHDVMETLYSSEYNKDTAFSFDHIREYPDAAGIEYSLAGDDYDKIKNIFLSSDASIVTSPHDHDVILLAGAQIPLRAKELVSWFINGKQFGQGPSAETVFRPVAAGTYAIKAITSSGAEEVISIDVARQDD
jgi:penicillin-binding protein 1C